MEVQHLTNMNKILKQTEVDAYKSTYDLMFETSNEMSKRKIFTSLIQHAQMLDYIIQNATQEDKILCVGSYEDVVAEVLQKLGYNITNIDPILNMDLKEYRKIHPSSTFKIVFATSVIEHVEDDITFLQDMCYFLEVGGLGVITCDFKPDYQVGDRLPSTSLRFYTLARLQMFEALIQKEGCELTTIPTWNESTPDNLDFKWEEIPYTFAGFSFKRKK
jgi:hypothetical protein